LDILKHNIVKTRKDHRCWGCARKFEKGTKMDSITSVDGGEISTDYWCSTCVKYWNEKMQDGEVISLGDLRYEDPEIWEEIKIEVEEKSL